jgi:transposase
MARPGRPSRGLDDYLYWQERLADREASGLSIDGFCADEGVSRSTFYRWVQRLKEGIPDASSESAKVPANSAPDGNPRRSNRSKRKKSSSEPTEA